MAQYIGDAAYSANDVTKRIIALEFTKVVNVAALSDTEKQVFDRLIEEMKKVVDARSQARITSSASRSHQQRSDAVEYGSVEYSSLQSAPPIELNIRANIPCIIQHLTTNCKHDMCHTFLKMKDTTPLEWETVQHYDLRIAAAKTDRIKEALRKQRHVQLEDDRKVWMEWRERVWNKITTFGGGQAFSRPDGPPTYSSVTQIVARDKRTAALSPDQQNFGQAMYRRIAENSDGTRAPWLDESRYITYLGPVRITQLDAVVKKVCDVFRMNAVLYPDVDNCCEGFTKQFRTILQHMPASKKDLERVTVNQILCYAIELVGAERKSPVERGLSKSLTGDVLRYLQLSVNLDEEFRTKCWTIHRSCVEAKEYPGDKFEIAKQALLQRSTHPAPLEILFDTMIKTQKNLCTIAVLAKKTEIRTNLQILVDILSQVQLLAGNRSSEYNSAIAGLYRALIASVSADWVSAEVQNTLEHLLNQAQVSLTQRVEKHEQETSARKEQAKEKAKKTYQQNPSLWISSINQEYAGMMLNDRDVGVAYCEDLIFHELCPEDSSDKHSWIEKVQQNISRGVAEAFMTYSHFNGDSEMPELATELSILFSETQESESVLFDGRERGLARFFKAKYRQGWCAVVTFVRLLILLDRFSASNSLEVKKTVAQLNRAVKKSSDQIPFAWRASISSLLSSTNFLCGHLIIECMHVFGRSDVDSVVSSLVWVTMVHIVTATDEIQAEYRLEFVMGFLKTVFGTKEEHINMLKNHLNGILKDEKLRCNDVGKCAK